MLFCIFKQSDRFHLISAPFRVIRNRYELFSQWGSFIPAIIADLISRAGCEHRLRRRLRRRQRRQRRHRHQRRRAACQGRKSDPPTRFVDFFKLIDLSHLVPKVLLVPVQPGALPHNLRQKPPGRLWGPSVREFGKYSRLKATNLVFEQNLPQPDFSLVIHLWLAGWVIKLRLERGFMVAAY